MKLYFLIFLLSLLGAQVRIEARLQEPAKKTNLQVEAQLTAQYLRWLYTGTLGGRTISLMDILMRPEGIYLLDHEKKMSYLLKPNPAPIHAAATPQLLKAETYLGYPAEKYRLPLSDGSEVIFIWTKAVGIDWKPWKGQLQDGVLAAILEGGVGEGLPLFWQHRSAQGEVLSEWQVEQIDSLGQDPYAGTLPYEAIPIEKAVQVEVQIK